MIVSSRHLSEAHLGFVKYLLWTFFAKIVNGCNPLTVFVKNSVVCVWEDTNMSPTDSMVFTQDRRKQTCFRLIG